MQSNRSCGLSHGCERFRSQVSGTTARTSFLPVIRRAGPSCARNVALPYPTCHTHRPRRGKHAEVESPLLLADGLADGDERPAG